MSYFPQSGTGIRDGDGVFLRAAKCRSGRGEISPHPCPIPARRLNPVLIPVPMSIGDGNFSQCKIGPDGGGDSPPHCHPYQRIWCDAHAQSVYVSRVIVVL